MARAAVLGRLTWLAGQLADVREETATARTLALDVPGWAGHLPGQHVDVRLTAEDGYSTERSYSIASAPGGTRIELTIQRLDDGEVSPYLTEVLSPGNLLELRGPIGGYFAWHPDDPQPILLIGGGSGVVPLMAMARTRAATGSTAPMRLIYSARSPATLLYAAELRRLAASGTGLTSTSPTHGKRRPGGAAPSGAWTPGACSTSRDHRRPASSASSAGRRDSWKAPPACSSSRASRIGRSGPSGSDPAEARHDETWTDGNSIGGPLRDVFSVDITAATGRCAGCGNTGPLAEGRVFSHAPGLVLRCPACGEALLRLARAPGRAWVDVRGLEYIELATPE